ncbi:guanylate kinase [Raphidocelis subcapitata]|uniref:guanylate kinase n=1 Tax=Raphidocelis subcapitata TaxID=307507 RepID=A0A2V0NYQ2_9CHLO|nr:guanylate kinase [Raphidocelis subcapitata]|eukprot:GBF92449.1 guanylate kinase [Raphidocelis subcapitata]
MGAEQSVPAAGEGGAAAAAGDPAQAAAPAQPGTSQPFPKALVIVGPSGVGKGTLIQELLRRDPQRYAFSVSTTTRAPRPGEQDGVHYAFTSKEAMMAAISRGEFLEHAEVHGALYGTRRDGVQAALAAGRVPLLDIDVQGARQVRASGLPALLVFVAPPSLEELERRLRGRGTDGEAQTQRRLGAAKGEIRSLNEKGLYDYLLINEGLGETADALARIAARAAAGLDAEPGHVPERVILEDDADGGGEGEAEEEDGAAAASVATTDGGTVASGAAQPRGGPSSSSGRGGGGGGGGGSGGFPAPGRVAPAPAAGPSPAAAAAELAAGLSRWRGRVALVTGASSGIGRAACVALGRAGLRVVAVARRRERLEELQRHMLGPEVGMAAVDFLPVVCDVTKEAEVQALPRIVLKRWPERGVDVLFNNAGLARK